MKHTLTVLIPLLGLSLTASGITGKRIKQPLTDELNQERVVGGEIAAEGLAPYQVSLQDDWRHFCGGSIISTEWILSAAHCVAYRTPSDVSVLTGTQNLEDLTGIHYYVDRIYVHCNYNNPDLNNDISLLHLNSSIVLNSKTQIIRLPSRPMKDGDEVILTGWGSEEYLGESPERLKMVALKYMEHKQCKKAHRNSTGVDVGHVCTFTQRGEGACHGDSGGPIAAKGTVIGVVNWGMPCAVGYPDVYASTHFYLEWMRTIMSGNSRCNFNALVKERK